LKQTLIALSMLAALPVSAGVVFDSMATASGTRLVVFSHDVGESSSTHEIPGGIETQSQSGQVVTLAGSDRLVSLLEAEIEGLRLGTETGTVSFATTVRVYSMEGLTPGTLLWEGTSPVTSLNMSGSGPIRAPISFSPNVVLPDTFAMLISHSNISGQNPNWYIGSSGTTLAPSVGTSQQATLFQDTATGAWDNMPTGQLPMYLRFRITAIPAPGSAGLLLGCGTALMGRRRR